jgi:UDP-N-acetylmuramoylalanine--D-glutamate ligase
MNWNGLRVAVIGLARSGVAACRFLKKRGARVVGVDQRTARELMSAANDLQAAGIEIALGAHPDLHAFDALVLSPGVDPAQEFIASARARGVLVLPELEVGALEAKGRIVCITGTKGKSTTTSALAAMLRDAGADARAVGNIGAPITAHVDDSSPETVFVIEASSFQLETTQRFRPNLAIFLNLFADHLDRHPSFEAYAEAKARIFANQTDADTALVNGEDPAVLGLAARTRARVIPFRPRTPPEAATSGPVACFEGNQAVYRDPAVTPLFGLEDLQIPGSAVRTNLLVAGVAALQLGVAADSIKKSVRAFNGIAHTFEKVGTIQGIAFYNDSKATTLESVDAALQSFETPVLLIMGGRLKAGSFTSLRETVSRRARAIHALGESRALIHAALDAVCPVRDASSMEEAVRNAFAGAQAGDTILLSPGCSSFDMFKDYADRGEAFRRAFERLSLEGAA